MLRSQKAVHNCDNKTIQFSSFPLVQFSSFPDSPVSAQVEYGELDSPRQCSQHQAAVVTQAVIGRREGRRTAGGQESGGGRAGGGKAGRREEGGQVEGGGRGVGGRAGRREERRREGGLKARTVKTRIEYSDSFK